MHSLIFYRFTAARKWIASQKSGEYEERYEEYMARVFPSKINVWPQEGMIQKLKEKCTKQTMYGIYPYPELIVTHGSIYSMWNKMQDEVSTYIAFYLDGCLRIHAGWPSNQAL